jgi:hypothetical protein
MISNHRADLLYREVQYFRQPWVWAIVLAVAGLSIFAMVKQLILGESFGSNPSSDVVVLIIGIVFGLGFPISFYRAKLTTEVVREGIHYRFFPFHLSTQKIPLVGVKTCEVITYSPLRDYGGWGIRFGSKGKAYNVSGNRGVRLELSNGKRILFGSQKPEELAAAVVYAMKHVIR